MEEGMGGLMARAKEVAITNETNVGRDVDDEQTRRSEANREVEHIVHDDLKQVRVQVNASALEESTFLYPLTASTAAETERERSRSSRQRRSGDRHIPDRTVVAAGPAG